MLGWQFVLFHTMSGFVSAIPALLLYFIVLGKMGKKQTGARVVASFVFCLYCVGICAETGLCLTPRFSPRLSLIPFVGMIHGPVGTALNVLLFMPLGIFLPLLYKRYDRISKVALTGFFISLSVEIAQMFGYGLTDINDLITNTAGACLGYWLYKRWLCGRIPKRVRKTVRAQGVRCFLETAVFWAGTLAIMLTVQRFVFEYLFYGLYVKTLPF